MKEKNIKICLKCKMEKDFSDFFNRKASLKDGKDSLCKECRTIMINLGKEKRRQEKSENISETELVISKNKRRKAKLFAFWLSIPGVIKDSKYFKRYFKNVKNIKITKGEEDSILPNLLNASTIAEVGKVLDIGVQTLMNWQNSEYVKDMERMFDANNDVMRFKKEIDFAFTQKTIALADAARVKLWKQLYEGWVEKTSQENTFSAENITQIQNKLRALAERKESKTLGPEELKIKLAETNGANNPTTAKYFLSNKAQDSYVELGTDAGGPGECEGDS